MNEKTGVNMTAKSKEGQWANTAAAKFIDKRMQELAPRKNQQEVAFEVGFERPNFMSMMKMGVSKVPLDRVPALAKALEVDPAHLFRLALLQHFKPEVAKAINGIFGDVVSKNEAEWLSIIRESTGDQDVAPNDEARQKVSKALVAVYMAGKEAAHQ